MRDLEVKIFHYPSVWISSPVNWTMDPFNCALWQLGFNGLEWLKADQDSDLIVDVLKDFHHAHLVRRIDNPFYDQMPGDHARALRVTKFLALREKFSHANPADEEAELIDALIESEIHTMLKPEHYFAYRYHNHALIIDAALLACWEALPKYRGLINARDVMAQACKTLTAMFDFNSGVTKEHSLEYQLYNWDIFRQFTDVSKRIHSAADGLKLEPEMELFYQRVTEASKTLLGLSLRADGSWFPFGDSPRMPPVKEVEALFGCRREQALKVARQRVKNMVWACLKEGFCFFRGYGRTKSRLDLLFLCGWHSGAHKQDDELSFSLDYNGRTFFDDAGYNGRLTLVERELLQCKHAHSTIVVEGLRWSPRKISDGREKIAGRLLGDRGCYAFGEHYRMDNLRTARELYLYGDSVLIVDSAQPALGRETRHRFVLGHEVKVRLDDGRAEALLSCGADQARFSVLTPGGRLAVDRVKAAGRSSQEPLRDQPTLDYWAVGAEGKEVLFFISFDGLPPEVFLESIAGLAGDDIRLPRW